ncbi:MAG: leucine-rich repeat domain-containing protein [Bdellovibrionota bacterium]
MGLYVYRKHLLLTAFYAMVLINIFFASCGSEKESSLDIYGGSEVTGKNWDTAVALVKYTSPADDKGEIFCSGVALTSKLIVTAAHCLKGYSSETLNTLRVYRGNGNESGHVSAQFTVESFAISPSYNHHPGSWGDLAYLKLNESIEGMPLFELAYDARDRYLLFNKEKNVTVLGFGLREDHRRGLKYKVDLRVNKSNPFEFKAGGAGKDACKGDSGGPAYFINAEGDVKIIGIVSRGSVCGEGGIFTSLIEHACWLQESSGIDFLVASHQCDFSHAKIQDKTTRDSFIDVCKQPNMAQKPTINALSIISGSNDCPTILQILSSRKVLNLSGFRLVDISPLAFFENLSELDVSGNYLSEIDSLTSMPNLHEVNIAQNYIIDLKPKFKGDVRVLGSKLQFHNFFSTEFLKLCMLTDDQPQDIKQTIRILRYKFGNESCAVVNNKLLNETSLELVSSGIRSLEPFKELQSLKTLNLNDNSVSDLRALDGLESLKYLNIGWHGDIDEHSWSILEQLQRRQSLKVVGKELVAGLHTSSSYFQQCPSRHFAKVRHAMEMQMYVNVYSCKDSNYFLRQVRQLNLSNLKLTHIGFLEPLQQLVNLDLSNNQIDDFSILEKLPSLKYVEIRGNPGITKGLINHLKARGVIVLSE